MNCKQMLTHVVREGDSFYNIARMHRMSMEALMVQNPGLDPYNLQVGTEIMICMDGSVDTENQGGNVNWENVMPVSNDMREVWAQDAYWMRMLIISIAEGLKDQTAVANRLMRIPSDMADVLNVFYPAEASDMISSLWTEHLQLGGALMTALKEGRPAEASQLNNRWYANANQIADVFSRMNPHYNAEELRGMLYKQLELLKQQMGARLSGNYALDIQVFDEIEQHAMDMADYLTAGLVQQFPQKFA